MKKGILIVGLLCALCLAMQIAFAAPGNSGNGGNNGNGGGINNPGVGGGNGGQGGSGGNGGNGGQGGRGGAGGSGGSATATSTGGSATAIGGVSEASSTNEGVSNSTSVNASDETKVYSYGHAVPTSALGTDGISIGTVFGGIGLSQTSTYAKTDNYIARLIEACKAGVMTEDECRTSHREALRRLENRSKSNDRGLLNMFGLF